MRDEFIHPSRRKKRRASEASPAAIGRIARAKPIPRTYEVQGRWDSGNMMREGVR